MVRKLNFQTHLRTFLYLKDAKYIQNSKLFPAAGRPLSIQIRVSDISTLSLVEFCQGKPADEQNT